MEQRISTIVDITDEKDIDSEPEPVQPTVIPQCKCGKSMETIQMDKCEANGRQRCSQCHFHFTPDQPFPYFYSCQFCPKVSLCQKCGEYSAKFRTKSVKDRHDVNKLFYIYTTSISGPYTIDEIIKLYINRKFKNKIYVQSASSYYDNWAKFVLPEYHRETLQKLDSKRCDMMEWCEQINEPFREKYPEVYKSFTEAIYSGKVQKVRLPKSIPVEEQKAVYWKGISVIGKIVLLFVVIIMLLHCLFTAFLVFLYTSFRVCLRETSGIKFERDWYFYYTSTVCASFGVFVTPMIIVFTVVRYTDWWNETQSWMIAYIIWGILTFITTAVIPYLQHKKKTKTVKKLMHAMFYIIGVDFGEHGFWTVTGAYKDGQNEGRLLMAFSYSLFSLTALLPSAIAGFIANYVLEEKFILRCGDVDICDVRNVDDTLCCQIIGSHDEASFYVFVGGLTTNLIATWAFLQIVGYLLLNAFPVFTLYAKRK